MTKFFPLAALALAATPALAEAPAMTGKIGDQTFLMNDAKMTLYTFDADKDGSSTCYDACAGNWPPLLASADEKLGKGYGLTERSDGTMQVTYGGKPLYLWIKDEKPGDMTGDGVKGVWHVARP